MAFNYAGRTEHLTRAENSTRRGAPSSSSPWPRRISGVACPARALRSPGPGDLNARDLDPPVPGPGPGQGSLMRGSPRAAPRCAIFTLAAPRSAQSPDCSSAQESNLQFSSDHRQNQSHNPSHILDPDRDDIRHQPPVTRSPQHVVTGPGQQYRPLREPVVQSV